MVSKKDRIRAGMTRRPAREGNLLKLDAERRGYRVVSVSLYTPEADFVDKLTRTLRDARIPRANRSLVLQQLILLGQEQLADKSSEQLVELFRERLVERVRKPA
jgi:hypothetical protein